MADFSWLHAVPIGLLMFAGTTFGVVRRAMGKRASRSAFPGLGAKLGLNHTPPETPGAAGTLKGEYLGYRVRIESEIRARAVVSFSQSIAIELRNYEHWKRTPDGYDVVSFEEKGSTNGSRIASRTPSCAQASPATRSFEGCCSSSATMLNSENSQSHLNESNSCSTMACADCFRWLQRNRR